MFAGLGLVKLKRVIKIHDVVCFLQSYFLLGDLGVFDVWLSNSKDKKHAMDLHSRLNYGFIFAAYCPQHVGRKINIVTFDRK